MSAIGLSTVLPERGQQQHFVIPRGRKKESPPEMINHEIEHQQRTTAPLAAPGSRGVIIGDARRGLRMSSSPADPESAAVAEQHRTGLSLAKLSGNQFNTPGGNLWNVPPKEQGKRRRPEKTAAVVEMKLPHQSPVRQVQWWRRPPSPLVSHMRPLWESNSGGDQVMVDLAPPDMKKISRRAPEEGEEEVAEQNRQLPRKRGSQPTPTEVSPEPEPEPLATGTPSSALSVDSTKFFSLKSSAREPRRQGVGGGSGGGRSWSYIAAAIAAANAPPPPTTNAPTAGAFAVAAGSANGGSGAGGTSYLEVLDEQERSPSRSPESSRPPSVRMIRQAFPPPPSRSPPPPPGSSKIASAVAAGRGGVKYFAPPGREDSTPRQSFRPVQQHHSPSQAQSPAPSRRVPEGRGRESTGRVGRRRTSAASQGAVDNTYGNDEPSRKLLDARPRSLESKPTATAVNGGGDVAPEESAGRMTSGGNPTALDSTTRHFEGTKDRGRSAPRPPKSPPTTRFQKNSGGVTASDDLGRVSPPPFLEGLAAGSGKNKSMARSGGNPGGNGGGASGSAGGVRNGRPAAVSGGVLSKMPRGGGGGGTLSAPSVSAGLAMAIAEMEKQQHKGEKEANTISTASVATAANAMPREGRRDGGGGNARGGDSSGQGSQGRVEAGAALAGEGGQERGDRDAGDAGAAQSLRLAYLSDLSSTRTSVSLVSRVSSQMQAQARAQGQGQRQGQGQGQTVNAMMISASSEENESDDGDDGGNGPPSSSVSSLSVSTSFTAVSSSTAATGVSGATSWTLRAPSEIAPPSEAAPPSTAGPETPQSLLSSDVHGHGQGLNRFSFGLETGAPGVSAAAAAPPSPTSSHASSLARSMRTRRRRRSGTGYVAGTGKGTRPERESVSSGSGAMSKSSQHLRRGYQRRRTPPSAESPLNVGVGVRAVPAHSRRKPRVNVVAGASGIVGVPRPGVGGGGGGGSGGVGNGGGGGNSSSRSLRLDDHGLRHMARGGEDDEAYERHYVNPMNAPAGAESSAGVPDDHKADVQGGALAKLLRRLNVLRKRWRRKRKNDASTTIASTSSNVSSNGSIGNAGGGIGGDGEYPSSAASDLEGEGDGAGGVKKRSKNGERDGPADEELEMACRRMLDGLWMSAKRRTDTLPISVADGRTLLTGLMVARAGEGGIDLGVPLPISLAAKWNTTSRGRKPLRPVVGGASGPFARAGRERDVSAGESDSGSRRREAAALRRAMELAMGVSQERDSFGRKGAGLTNAAETAGGVGGYHSLAEWCAVPNRSGVSPSDSRHHARRSSTRAKLHRELRKESAAVGLTVGRTGKRETGDNNSDGGSSRASSVLSSSSRGSSKSYQQQQHRVSSRGSHRVNRHRHTGSGGSGGSRSSRGSHGSRSGSGVMGFRDEHSDGESERLNRSQTRSGSSSRRGASHSIVTRTARANTVSVTDVGDGRDKSKQQQQRSSGSRGGNTISAREGLRTAERQIREGSASASRSRSRGMSSSSRPVAAGEVVVDSTESSTRGGGRGVPGVSDNGRGDGGGDGGRRSREQRNHGPSVGSRFDERRRPRSQPPRGKGD